MNTKISFFQKLLFFITMFLFLSFPMNVYAGGGDVDPGGDGDSEDFSGFENFQDLDNMHINMEGDTGYVYISEVRNVQENGSVDAAFNFAYDRFQSIIVGFSGVCTLTFVLIFLITFVNIGASSSNPQKKAELSKALVWIGIGAAGFGSVTLILGLAFGLFTQSPVGP